MKTWKTHRRPWSLMRPRSLQWGHGDEAVEDDVDDFDDPCTRLQWGHVDEDVEDRSAAYADRVETMLQWGHVDEDVEERPSVECQSRRYGRFNGATSMKPWKTSHGR